MRRFATSVLLVSIAMLWCNLEGAAVSSKGRTSQQGDPTTDAAEDTVRSGAFEKVVLTEKVTYPMELAVAKDGRVFVGERDGVITMWDPSTDSTRTVGFVPVRMTVEDGLLGLTIDPDFDENGWLYVYYAPADGGPSRLSRLPFRRGGVDLAGESILLEIPTQYEECCHSAGSLTFGPEGNLYLSTGDNTDPYPLGGSPIDERPGRKVGDAQRTSANTNDLRGKIIRIRPTPDGGYTIPEGNLFEGDSLHRPEIYTMGHRNPYRISVDPETGWLYWGDIGIGNPPSEERGPWGWEELNQAREPGFYGWPYFVGPNDVYRDYDYETETAGAFFDPENPVNESPNNTGAAQLPAARPAFIWYTYGQSDIFPELEAGGMSAMAGPVYRYDPETASPFALPSAYDGSFFIYEWMRNWIKEVKIDSSGEFQAIEPFMPEETFARPMDMEVGPDGRLYVIEWGETFWGANRDAKIVRIDYHGSALRPPKAAAEVDPRSGAVPLEVNYTASGGNEEDTARELQYEWDFDNDGVTDALGRQGSFTYREPGNHVAHLTVSDAHGRRDTARVQVTAGNTAPDVRVVWPPNGGFFDYNSPIAYRVEVSDPDGGRPDEGSVVVQTYTGHDTHEHPLLQHRGATGEVPITEDYTHVPDIHLLDRFGVLEARYLDDGAAGGPPVLATARVILQPKRKEAEHFAENQGAERKTYGKHQAEPDFAETAMATMEVEDGDELVYRPIDLTNIEAISVRVKAEAGGTIELRANSSTGPVLTKMNVASEQEHLSSTASNQTETAVDHGKAIGQLPDDIATHYEGWKDVRVPVRQPAGMQSLHLIARGEKEGTLLRIDHIDFVGKGVMKNPSD